MGDHFGPPKTGPISGPNFGPIFGSKYSKNRILGAKVGNHHWPPRNVVLDFQNSLCPTISIWTNVGTTPMHYWAKKCAALWSNVVESIFSGTQPKCSLLLVCFGQNLSKVTNYLQWAKCCRGNLGGKRPLFINMDETSISFHYGQQKGLVVSKHSLPPNRKHKKETVKTEDAKARRMFPFLHFLHMTQQFSQSSPRSSSGTSTSLLPNFSRSSLHIFQKVFFYGAKSPLGIMLYS